MGGFLEQLGVKGLETAQKTPLDINKVILILACVLIFVVVAVITFIVVWNKGQAKKYNKKIEFAQEVNGKVYLTSEDWARELNLPNTSIKVFLLKEKGTFYPKLVYTIGKNRYLLFVDKGGQIVNTDLRYGKDGIVEINDTLKPVRDYANENLKDLINKHWTDKNKNWWKENSHLVFLIIICVLIVISLIISGVQNKKERASNLAVADANLKASQNYADAQTNFIKFLEEHYADSGVKPATGGG